MTTDELTGLAENLRWSLQGPNTPQMRATIEARLEAIDRTLAARN